MKTIEEQLAFYAAYHRNPWNIATHFLGIPTIICSILIPLAWIRMEWAGLPLTGALVFTIIVWCYYIFLDHIFAVVILLPIIPIYAGAEYLAQLSWRTSILWAVLLFVGGWILQLLGHTVFEKRKPAFLDNLIQLLIGPLFLLAEVVFALGFRKKLHETIVLLSHQHEPSVQK